MRTARAGAAADDGGTVWRVHAALLGTQIGFALFPVVGKLALDTIPPLVLAPIRVVTAAAMLEAVRRLAGGGGIAPRDRGTVLLLALLGVSFNQILFVVGLSLTTAINTTILAATIPVFTLGAAVLLGQESLSARAVVGLLLAGSGALLLLNVRNLDWQSRYVRGNLLILASALSYSFYLVLSRPILARVPVSSVIAGVFLYGAPPIVLFAVPALTRFSPASVTARSWASLAAVIVFSTVVPYSLNSWALARAEASRVAFYVFLQPLIAATLAILVLGESLSGKTVVAGVLILAGLAISILRRATSGDAPA